MQVMNFEYSVLKYLMKIYNKACKMINKQFKQSLEIQNNGFFSQYFVQRNI